MAGSKRRLTRASEKERMEADEAENWKKQCAQADLPANTNTHCANARDIASLNVSANSVEPQPCTSETNASEENIDTFKEESPNSFKGKRILEECGTEKENMKLSKAYAHEQRKCKSDTITQSDDTKTKCKTWNKKRFTGATEKQSVQADLLPIASHKGSSHNLTSRLSANQKLKLSASKTNCQQKASISLKKRRLSQECTEKQHVKISKNGSQKRSMKNKHAEKDSNNNEHVKSKYFSSHDYHKSMSTLSKFKATKKSLPSTNSLPKGQFQKLCHQSQFESIGSVKTKNVYHHYFNSILGRSLFHNTQSVSRVIASQLSDYEIQSYDKPFQCRITSIEWHPRKRNFLGVGSKHGDMIFYKVESKDNSKLEELHRFPGIGPGGNISCMKFHPTVDNLVYTSSLCGKVALRDVEGCNIHVLLDTMDWENWYSSLDVHKTDFFVAAGRNKGGAVLLTKDGKCIWDKRLHRQKISHLEFSPSNPNIFCTASLDHTVKLWDLRKVEEKNSLKTLPHNRGLNSAYFSLTDGCRLLTTDQSNEIRIYSTSSWNLERTILHPHRFFQHLTPIKAYWHPLKDIVLCGRYPDDACPFGANFLRCIDMFDASTGQHLGEMFDNSFSGIISLVKMNNEATKLVCAMGYNVNLWNMAQGTLR